MEIKTLALNLGLSVEEYKLIIEKLDREPTELETYLYSAQWSEHCGYKHSKEFLKNLPMNIENENAGYIKIDDYAVVFKVESHNHPSAVEPYQGAATGIGGIVRDVLAMGARPIALLDSLKFGNIEDAHSKNIFEGVVEGISGYGNSIGVPTVAGETYFDETYSTNPLVNVMCVGLAKEKELTYSKATNHNKKYIYVGAKTGRDGIHGASFASKELSGRDDRPSVQVGDPFSEKNLIEATLEILKIKGVLACQDMGAAGLLSSISEMSFKGDLGCELYIDKIPLREKNMKPWEIMLSESQERMLFLIDEGCEKSIKKVVSKYMLDYSEVGKTIYEKRMKIYKNEEIICDTPLEPLVNAPSLKKVSETPSYFYVHRARKYPKIEKHPKYILKEILKHPNIANKNWIYQQYDYKVGNNTIVEPGEADSSILWIKDTNRGFAVTIDSNPLYTYLNPYEGSRNIVYEAARNIISTGAIPQGVTDNLNFGDPEESTVNWQFEQSVKGISNACRELETPITGGNVSFYNESKNKIIYPTPVIGMVGTIKNVNNIKNKSFKNIGDIVYIVGKTEICSDFIGGSIYLKILQDFVGGEIDKVKTLYELGLQKTILNLINKNLVNAVHDISKGGIAVAVLESSFSGLKGFKGFVGETNEQIFGENQSRFIVSVPAEKNIIFEKEMFNNKMDYLKLGIVTPKEYGIDLGFGKMSFEELYSIFNNSVRKHMEE